MGLYLFIIKLVVAAWMTKRFIRSGDASYHAGLLALMQVVLLALMGQPVAAVLFHGVFAYTLWLGFFMFLEYAEDWHIGWTCAAVAVLIPVLCQL